MRQLLANVLSRPVLSRTMPNATAIGAALLAVRMLGSAVPRPRTGGELIEPAGSTEDRYARFCALTDEVLRR